MLAQANLPSRRPTPNNTRNPLSIELSALLKKALHEAFQQVLRILLNIQRFEIQSQCPVSWKTMGVGFPLGGAVAGAVGPFPRFGVFGRGPGLGVAPETCQEQFEQGLWLCTCIPLHVCTSLYVSRILYVC